MKLTFLTSLLLTVVAVAAAGDPKPPIAKDGQCKKDGSMGNCETGYCNQPENASQGTCEDPK